MNVYEDYDLLARDIRRQPQLIRDTAGWFNEVSQAAASKLSTDVERIYLVGCGDSLDVGGATRFSWERLLNIPVEPVPALTFSRYLVNSAPRASLVVGLSQSGKVSRVSEAIRLAHERGMQTIAVTGSPDSRLAQDSTTATIMTPFPKIGPIPGTSSYTYNMALFYELGASIADMWGCAAAEVQHVRGQLRVLPGLIESSLAGIWQTAEVHAAETADRSLVPMVLGTGPNWPTARFTVRKLYEVPQIASMSQETEEYAHDQYAMIGPRTPVWLHAPAGASADRDVEIYHSLERLGAPVAVITEGDMYRREQPRWRYELATGLDEFFSPLLYSLPSQVYCYELAKRIGGSFYGNADLTHRTEGDPLIYDSAMIA